MASPIKRNRRTKQDLEDLLTAVSQVVSEYSKPITIRHLYYRLVGLGVIEKTQAQYNQLCSHLSKWRRDGLVHWGHFADNTRWRYGGTRYSRMQDALANMQAHYRRDLWQDQDVYVEVWCEKDAITSILTDIVDSFSIPVFSCRGFTSLSSLYNSAELFRDQIGSRGKDVVILYVGDHDPSGVMIDASAEKTLRDEFDVAVDFRRVAVTKDQIEQFSLPTRPAKKSDKRSIGWDGGCVEIDAMRPDDLERIIWDELISMIDPNAWKMQQQIEEQEKLTLNGLLAKLG